MLLEGKRILVTGITNDTSLAFPVARIAQEEGAEVVLSSFGRVMSITRRAARRLPIEPSIVELDVSNQDDLDALADRVGGCLDGVVHSIAFAPPSYFQINTTRRSCSPIRSYQPVTTSFAPAFFAKSATVSGSAGTRSPGT